MVTILPARRAACSGHVLCAAMIGRSHLTLTVQLLLAGRCAASTLVLRLDSSTAVTGTERGREREKRWRQ